ncbi:MAG: hypothetical protein M0C28_19960, partial [Candidatus Moduliflexus flocculans]|nr:hypothetical protein [Candidatus Moduliflexus flocculans]
YFVQLRITKELTQRHRQLSSAPYRSHSRPHTARTILNTARARTFVYGENQPIQRALFDLAVKLSRIKHSWFPQACRKRGNRSKMLK